MASYRKTARKRLKSKLRPEVVSSYDTQDSNLEAHVEEVIKNFKSLGPLEKISLLTPEDANKALKILAETQDRLNQQLKAASALKRLLSERAS